MLVLLVAATKNHLEGQALGAGRLRRVDDKTRILSIAILSHYAECDVVECHHGDCHHAECHHAECHHAECHHAECHHAECHYAECHLVCYQTGYHLLMSLIIW